MNGIIGGVGQIALATGAAVGTSFIAEKIPMPHSWKPAIPLSVGLLTLAFANKMPGAKAVAIGCGVAGGLPIIARIMPKVPVMPGFDVAPQLDANEKKALGLGAPMKAGYQNGRVLGAPMSVRTLGGNSGVNVPSPASPMDVF